MDRVRFSALARRYTLLHERTLELLRLLSVRNIPMEQITAFLATFIRENRFRQVEFDEMNREFVEKFGDFCRQTLKVRYCMQKQFCF